MSALEKWGNLDLNQGPTGYESAALTTELLPLKTNENSIIYPRILELARNFEVFFAFLEIHPSRYDSPSGNEFFK